MTDLWPAPRSRVEVLTAVVVAVVVAAVGAPLGLLAAALTPRVGMSLFRDPSQGYPTAAFVQSAEENRAAIGGDGVLIAVLAGAGLLFGLAAVLLRRRAPFGAVLGVLVGGLVAGLVAMAVAHVVVHGGYAAVPASALDTGKVFQLRPYIRGRVDFVVLPTIALIVFLLANVRWMWRTGRSAPAERDTLASAGV